MRRLILGGLAFGLALVLLIGVVGCRDKADSAYPHATFNR